MTVTTIMISVICLPMTLFAQCTKFPPTSTSTCNIQCDETATGSITANGDVYYIFENPITQSVSFTNCDSTRDSQMYLLKLTNGNIISDSNYQSNSDNNCDGNGCYDSNHACSTTNRETFTFDSLEADTFWIKYSNPSSLSGSYAIKITCGVSLIPDDFSPAPGEYHGATLIVRGFNIIEADVSNSPILDYSYIANMTHLYSSEGQSCSYASLTFDNEYEQFSSYSREDSVQISAEYGTDTYSIGGSGSASRISMKSNAQKAQYYIYTLALDCKLASADLVSFNLLHWNPGFIDRLRILPTTYNSNNLLAFKKFWEIYGTHIFKSAEFGGKVNGATIVNKCKVAEKWGSSTQYKACLNAAYTGISSEVCRDGSEKEYNEEEIESVISKTEIVVRGGNVDTYSRIFNTFGEKTTDFGSWLNNLYLNPFIVGGSLFEIHEVILETIQLGNHNLNVGTSSVSDDTLKLIANAMKLAYQEYSSQISLENNYFGLGECNINCNGKKSNLTQCICIGCTNALDCCQFSDGNKIALHYTYVFIYSVVILFSVCFIS